MSRPFNLNPHNPPRDCHTRGDRNGQHHLSRRPHRRRDVHLEPSRAPLTFTQGDNAMTHVGPGPSGASATVAPARVLLNGARSSPGLSSPRRCSSSSPSARHRPPRRHLLAKNSGALRQVIRPSRLILGNGAADQRVHGWRLWRRGAHAPALARGRSRVGVQGRSPRGWSGPWASSLALRCSCLRPGRLAKTGAEVAGGAAAMAGASTSDPMDAVLDTILRPTTGPRRHSRPRARHPVHASGSEERRVLER
jgi:hypothetical protein